MRTSITCCVVALLVVGCGDHSVEPTGPGTIVLEVTYAQEAAAKAVAIQAVDRMVATVSAGGAVVVQRDLQRSASRWRGEMEVDAGTYQVRLEAYKLGQVKWRGDTSVKARAGKRTTAALSMVSTNTPPVAGAGPDQRVVAGTRVVLTGGGSFDADGDALTYAWDPPSGVTLSSRTSVTPSFTAGAVGTYRIGLVVSDGLASSARDEVVITVIEATHADTTIVLPGGATMDFMWMRPGTFPMGSPSSDSYAYDGEKPQHEVTISRGFWLGKYEMTQGQWQAVMGTTPWSGQSYVQADASHPAVCISWTDVQELVAALNASAGAGTYRLPTEAEWEYACRAGTTTRWSFGDEESRLGDYVWYRDNAWNAGLQYAQPVGTKGPNPWGLFDMHGNVCEWVQDWCGNYTSASQTDPTGPSTGSYAVFGAAASTATPKTRGRRIASPPRWATTTATSAPVS